MMKHTTTAAPCAASRENAHTPWRVGCFEDGVFSERLDSIIQELRFDLYVDGYLHERATCSPWDIEELVVGRLFLDGTIADAALIDCVRVDEEAGRVEVALRRPAADAVGGAVIVPFERARRRAEGRGFGMAGGEGGLCGARQGFARAVATPRVSARIVASSMAMLEKKSLLFRKTGGVHSAVLADAQGSVLAWFEDIGRHSAVDKLAGWCVLNDIDVADKMLLFSGRVPHEIIAKVAALGIPLIASPGAPTNLSIEEAEAHGITLVGFAKRGRFNIYTHPERILA